MTTQTDTGPHAEPTEYEVKARDVLALRQQVAEKASRIKAARETWEAEHWSLLAAHAHGQDLLVQAEAEWRRVADAVAHARGVKSLEYGVVVKEATRLVYDDAQALAWARTSGIGLALDKKAFESVAKVSLGTTPALAFVAVETTRTVALPNTQRLAEALGAASEEAAS